MAIASDTTSNSGGQFDVSSFSYSHTCTGSDLLLYSGVSMEDVTDADRTVTGITYNSVSMTSIREDDNDTDNFSSSIWYLAGPATGSNTVAVTLNGENALSVSGSISLTGVDQSSPLDANNGATGNSNVPTVDVTTVADNSWVIDTVAYGDNTFTIGSGQTSRWTVGVSTLGSTASTEGPVTPAGATTMDLTFDFGASEAWAISAASFQPVAAAGTVKTKNTIAIASVKTVNVIAIANVKTIDTIATT